MVMIVITWHCFSLMDSPCSFTQSVLAFLPCLGSGLELEMEVELEIFKKVWFLASDICRYGFLIHFGFSIYCDLSFLRCVSLFMLIIFILYSFIYLWFLGADLVD
jgi:hypothetical protein